MRHTRFAGVLGIWAVCGVSAPAWAEARWDRTLQENVSRRIAVAALESDRSVDGLVITDVGPLGLMICGTVVLRRLQDPYELSVEFFVVDLGRTGAVLSDTVRAAEITPQVRALQEKVCKAG